MSVEDWSRVLIGAGGIGQECLQERKELGKSLYRNRRDWSKGSVRERGIIQECTDNQLELVKSVCRSSVIGYADHIGEYEGLVKSVEVGGIGVFGAVKDIDQVCLQKQEGLVKSVCRSWPKSSATVGWISQEYLQVWAGLVKNYCKSKLDWLRVSVGLGKTGQ